MSYKEMHFLTLGYPASSASKYPIHTETRSDATVTTKQFYRGITAF
ncbi:hypothetical protein [Providencia alcalifaciens]|nr:hypothetical protein [Providencia alcalifaciens]